MTDPISDMFIRIKNAQAVHKTEVVMPASKMKEQIAHVLVREGYANSVKREKGEPGDSISISLKYANDVPAIHHLKRASKPGLRQYKSADNFPRPLSGHGLVIVSTTKGVMSGRAAEAAGLGGEVIATAW